MLLMLLYIVSLFRTIIVIVVFVLLVRFIRQLLFPSAARKESNRQSGRNDGETTIHFNQKGKKIVNKDEGEYVDFEEID